MYTKQAPSPPPPRQNCRQRSLLAAVYSEDANLISKYYVRFSLFLQQTLCFFNPCWCRLVIPNICYKFFHLGKIRDTVLLRYTVVARQLNMSQFGTYKWRENPSLLENPRTNKAVFLKECQTESTKLLL
jgi:hypothetical protein